MKVLKFGGTSVGSIRNINKVISILKKYSEKDSIICVVSAIGGITDKLLEAGKLAQLKNKNYKKKFKVIEEIHLSFVKALIPNDNETLMTNLTSRLNKLKRLLDGIYLINELSKSTTDKLLSYGERLSSIMIAETMISRGLDAKRKNSRSLIVTNSNFSKADVIYKSTNKKIVSYFSETEQKITILPGFISKSEKGERTTLGRGGSDFTAAIVAAALKANSLEIWTDVSGMFTANPKIVTQAQPIKKLSYKEAMELSHFGAKVIYPPTIQPVLNLDIPIHIKNTLKPDEVGTIISKKSSGFSGVAKGISHINNVSLLTLQGNGMVGIPGFSKRLFETLANQQINIVLITQASSEHSICIGINQNDVIRAREAINSSFKYEIALQKIDPIIIEKNLSIIALVGDKMKSHQGISGKLFSSLGKNNINIRAIAQGASEKNISAVIAQNDVKKALNTLHECFFEGHNKQLNVFITGVGNVGKKLVEQINQQQNYLKEHFKITIRIIGLSNSKTMCFNEQGIDLSKWNSTLTNANPASINGFQEMAKSLNLRNSIFIDITANKLVSKTYASYLKESIAVVACNKIACSSRYENYLELKQLSLKYNAPFFFETNVGAGLPILSTLNNLLVSGDKVTSIEAVLSGSLNFIFNHFNNKTKFHDVVKQAQKEGYTEPDPRIDLSGVDVARKILILARESGLKMNLEDITNTPFLTKNNQNTDSVEDFYRSLIEDETHFKKLYTSAAQKKCQLKYVAELNHGKAKVSLKEIPNNHPFYNLEGKDNIVMLFTNRYQDQPLIVKGAGAGAEVTASGLFADIIKIGNHES